MIMASKQVGYYEVKDGDIIDVSRSGKEEVIGVDIAEYKSLYAEYERYKARLKEVDPAFLIPPKSTDDKLSELIDIIKAQNQRIAVLEDKPKIGRPEGSKNKPKGENNES